MRVQRPAECDGPARTGRPGVGRPSGRQRPANVHTLNVTFILGDLEPPTAGFPDSLDAILGGGMRKEKKLSVAGWR